MQHNNEISEQEVLRRAHHNAQCKAWRDKRTPEQKAAYRAQQREYQRDRYHNDPKYREYSKRSKLAKRLNRSDADWIKQWFNIKRNQCKRLGTQFELDLDWVQSKMATGKCEVTKIDFIIPSNTQVGEKIGPFTPSLDRIDISKGYTKENTRIVLWALNAAVGTWGDEIAEQIFLAFLVNKGYQIIKESA